MIAIRGGVVAFLRRSGQGSGEAVGASFAAWLFLGNAVLPQLAGTRIRRRDRSFWPIGFVPWGYGPLDRV